MVTAFSSPVVKDGVVAGDAATARRRPRATAARETEAHGRTPHQARRADVKATTPRAAAPAATDQVADPVVMDPAGTATAVDDGTAATAHNVRRAVSDQATAVRLSSARPVDVFCDAGHVLWTCRVRAVLT